MSCAACLHINADVLYAQQVFAQPKPPSKIFCTIFGARHNCAVCALQIPQEIEDDPQEYEGEVDDAPSEDFDDEEDEEGGIAFPEGTSRCVCMPNHSDLLRQQVS